MREFINLAIVLEMLFVNLFVVDVCAHKRYTKKITIASLLAFTAVLTVLTFNLWGVMDFERGNGSFALFGVAFLIPIRFLYKEHMLQLTGILFTSWVYTMLTFSLSVCFARILPLGGFLESVFLIQSIIYCVTLYYFIHWIKHAFLFVLQHTTPKIKHYLPYISFSWFVTIIIINLTFLYAEMEILHIISFVAIGANITMSYLLIHSLVKSLRDVENLEEIVYVDNLTGLYNRTKLFIDGEKMIARNIPFELIFLDLDKFKTINDQFGHLAGDEYLKFFARNTANLLGKDGILYRMSGDEFICLYVGKDSQKVIGKLLNYPKALPGSSIAFLGCSIGQAKYPQDSNSLDELIRIADNMMYQDKQKKHRLEESP